MDVDKEIIAKICSLIRGIEREGYSSSWLLLCCCAVACAGCHSGQGSQVCNSTTISSEQEPCSTLAGVGHFGHRFSPFWPRFRFALSQRADSEMRFVDVPERTEENLVITVSREERTQNLPLSWAEPHMHQHSRFEYPAHLRS